MHITGYFHSSTCTWSYVVAEAAGSAAAIVDPVLDFDAAAGRVSTESAQQLVEHVARARLHVEWILETHAHADHLSAASWLKRHWGGVPRIGIGAGIVQVQERFAAKLALEAVQAGGGDFDRLFRDGERFAIGSLEVEVLGTPGHTSDSVSYRIGDHVFIGDTLFSPDAGTARCDFPGGDAATLYASIRRLYALPDSTRLNLCHDYPRDGAAPRSEIPLAEMRAHNIHVRADTPEADFVNLRTRRDATLAVPKLLYPALQANLRAGRLPEPDAHGRRFFKLPVSDA